MDSFGGCAAGRCWRADFRLRQRGSGDAHRASFRPEHNERCARVADYVNAITDSNTVTISRFSPHSRAAGTSITCAFGENHRQAVG